MLLLGLGDAARWQNAYLVAWRRPSTTEKENKIEPLMGRDIILIMRSGSLSPRSSLLIQNCFNMFLIEKHYINLSTLNFLNML